MGRIRARVTVLDKQFLALQIGHHPLPNRIEMLRLNRAVHLTPVHLVGARRLADGEFIVRRAARVLAGMDDERALGP